jgi:hypothetical protein
VVVIGLHAAPILVRSERGTLWPFLQYAMYKSSSPPGPIQMTWRHLFGVTSQGRRTEVTPEVLGASITVLEDDYLRPMAKGDASVAGCLFARLNRQRSDPFVELRLVSEEYTATDTGVAVEKNPDMSFHSPRSGGGEPSTP